MSKSLHVKLSTGLARVIQKHYATSVALALHHARRDYTFTSEDPDVIRAFWIALQDIHASPARGSGGAAIGAAAGTKMIELRPILQEICPEVLAETTPASQQSCPRCEDSEWPCFFVDGVCRMCQARRRDDALRKQAKL